MRKAIQKEIIFIPLTIILVSIGLFLFAKIVKADCYVLYPYADPQSHPAIPCLSELPKGFTDNYADAGYEYYRFFKMSNCHCKANPVGNDYYEFDNVCSIDILYWPSNLTEKKVPLYYNQCSVCSPSQHEYHFSRLIVGRPTGTNDYIPESILTAPSDYVSKKLGITPEEYFNRIASWKEAFCVQTKGPELVKPYLEDDEYEETTYTTCTYTPCQVLPTCQKKCQKEHPLPEGSSGLSGRCLSSPEPENGFPKSLKQDGQYDDCLRGQSCYCYNTKPYVESVSLSVDPVYKDKFENYDDGVITEYDPLICEAIVYDADKGDQAEGRVGALVAFRIEAADGKYFSWVESMGCKFNENTKRYKCTKRFKLGDRKLPENTNLSGGIRGKKIKCEVIPRDAYQNGNSRASNEFIIAQFNYYFVHLNPPEVTNYKEQYKLFTELSAVNDTIEDTGKALYIKQRFPLAKEDFRNIVLRTFLGRVQLEDLTLRELYYIGSLGVLFPKLADFMKQTGLEWNIKKDRIIGMSDVLESGLAEIEKEYVEFFNPEEWRIETKWRFGDSVFIPSRFKDSLVHELGHTYGLCDEYFYSIDENGYINQLNLFSCDNVYPSCCTDGPENELRKKLDQEANKGFRDGLTFQGWVVKNFNSLTTEELFGLRGQSPCRHIGGECLYFPMREEGIILESNPKAPEGYVFIQGGTSFNNDSLYCPPENKRFDLSQNFAGCFIKKEKIEDYGKHCYNSVGLIDSAIGNCAGMPLKQSANLFIENPTDLTSSYRSIMGYGYQPSGIYRYPSKAKYPLNPK